MSLELKSSTYLSWIQHFTIAEIFKAKGLLKNAVHHFHLTLDLHPGFQLAEKHLQEIQSLSLDIAGIITYYTMTIIFLLVFFAVLCLIFSLDVFNTSIDCKKQRHFNRAMAMCSMKLGVTRKNSKVKK